MSVGRAFSLMEVVVAVAVFAGTIVAVLGLLGPTLQTTREVIDSAVAARLADGVDQELKRFVADQGFDVMLNVAGEVDGIEIYASVDGSSLLLIDDWDALPDDDPEKFGPYFKLSVELLDEPASTPEFAALNIEVEWPHQAGGTVANDAERKWFSFNSAIRP